MGSMTVDTETLKQITVNGKHLADQKRFVPVTLKKDGKKWSPAKHNLPENWKTLHEIPCGGQDYPGMMLKGSKILILDGDNVFKLDEEERPGIREDVAELLNVFWKAIREALDRKLTYCEYSLSDTGFHMAVSLEGLEDNTRQILTDKFYLVPPKARQKSLYDGGHIPCIEAFYGTEGKITLTGRRMKGNDSLEIITGETAAAVYDAFVKLTVQQHIADESGKSERFSENDYSDKAQAAVIKDALFAIPADDRRTWLIVCQALQNCGFSFDLFDEWSGKNTSAGNYGETQKKWNEFKKKKGHWNAGTIFRLAQENGWEPPKQEKQSKKKKKQSAAGQAVPVAKVTFSDIKPDGSGRYYPAYEVPAGWTVNDMGVSFIRAKGDQPEIVHILYEPLLPVENVTDIHTGIVRTRIAYKKNGIWNSVLVNRDILANASKITALSDYGIIINSNTGKQVVYFLSFLEAKNQHLIIPRFVSESFGWDTWQGKRIFIPYASQVKYLNATNAALADAIQQKGTLENWQGICRELRRNIVCRFVMAASASSPLLSLLGNLPFILHIWGGSGTGKTVVLFAGASIWGSPSIGKFTESLNTTINGMEKRAAALNHLPYFADELQSFKGKDKQNGGFDELVYSFTEGKTRQRLTKDSQIMQADSWTNCMVTSGEEPLVKANSRGGSHNRVIQVRVDRPLIEDGNRVSTILKENYGHAGEILVNYMKDHFAEIKDYYNEIFASLIRQGVTGKQAGAAASVLAGDFCLIECGLFSEDHLTAEDVLPLLKTENDIDVAVEVYRRTLDWISANLIRFRFDTQSGEFWGDLDESTATINKSVFDRFLRTEHLPEFEVFKKQWAAKGMLQKNSQGKYTHQTTVRKSPGTYVKICRDVSFVSLM